MRSNFCKNHPACARRLFFASLMILLIPLLIFPFISWNYHKIFNLPIASQGTLDLKGYDFSTSRPLPLDGDWEFFWDKWIVTDGLQDPDPDALVHVPLSWVWYHMPDGETLPLKGYASYRLQLRNCPPNQKVLCYTPNLSVAYRVFLNGALIASSGTLSKTPTAQDITQILICDRLDLPDLRDGELVIEVSSAKGGGLFIAPVLVRNDFDFLYVNLRYILASAMVGLLVVLIITCVIAHAFTGTGLHTLTLLYLDVGMLLRLLIRDEFFGIVRFLFPFFRYYLTSAVIRALVVSFPVIFLLSSGPLADIHVERRFLRRTVVFEIFCGTAVFFLAYYGRGMLAHWFGLFSLLPYIWIMRISYQNVKAGVPRSLVISLESVLVLSALIITGQVSSGLLLFNASLYPFLCFLVAMLCQAGTYISRLLDLRVKALETASLRLELQERETALMLSQIRPHFLYNALLAIQTLCSRNPETAAHAIMHFSKYLRSNMASIECKEPIPFQQELEHIENYVYLERLRFQRRLTVEYDIQASDFYVPALTIQPLMENAIRHGACKRMSEGTVWMRTYETSDANVVEVRDNGPGFDTAVLENASTGSYGLRNIRFRLEHMMRAKFEIVSVLDKGTCVTVYIPKMKGEKGVEQN